MIYFVYQQKLVMDRSGYTGFGVLPNILESVMQKLKIPDNVFILLLKSHKDDWASRNGI